MPPPGLREGDTVFVEGTRAKEMSFVALGTVKIVKATPTRSVILRIVGAGSPVGIVAAWEGRPYPGTATAIEPSTIVHVPNGSSSPSPTATPRSSGSSSS